ncbi:MAG: hypothetical protein L0Z62_37960 [Gemmataceae bacterium]|nr:hypothetical protein [Gemmataceae bacterium]
MLKANVGLSRKITRDFNSTGYSVNLEGEVAAGPGDAEGVLAKIQELFHLAEEALNVEIDRDQGEQAIGRRDEEPPSATAGRDGQSPSTKRPPSQREAPAEGKPRSGSEETATNKQVQYLLNVGKRVGLTGPQLDERIAQVIGRRCGVYDLTKREAGAVLDQLTKGGDGQAAGR